MSYSEISINTSGERFYDITKEIEAEILNVINNHSSGSNSGVVHLFIKHTSCALTISEAHEKEACLDVESFLKHIAPRDLNFIQHDTEGPDDSPSHMKSAVLNQSMTLIIDNKKPVLGTWQGIYLAEFRDSPKTRKVIVKFQPDL